MKDFFLLMAIILIFFDSKGQDTLNRNSANTNTVSYKFKKYTFDKNILMVFEEIVTHSEYCDFFQKDSMIFFVRCVKQDDNNYYFFIRPYQIRKLPNVNDYNFYGASKINNEIFLFSGISDSFFCKKAKCSSVSFSLSKNNINNDDPYILCDGCRWIKKLELDKKNITIEAEICK